MKQPSATTPVEINFYDPATDEIAKTFRRSFIPWGILKKALRLAKSIDLDNPTEADMDELAGFVVAVYGDQFGVEDVNNGMDVNEMVTVIEAVIGRATRFVAGKKENPTPAT